MRALAGPAMLLVVVGGFGLYRLFSKPESPPRKFLDLEFAGADRDHTGSCYSLSTILVANMAFRRDVVSSWKQNGEESWTLSLQAIQDGYDGPVHSFRHFTFEQHEDRVRLVSVEASKGVITGVRDNINELLEAPRERDSTPVDRCLEPGATGYRFKSGKAAGS